ncbi:hypothetical protein [Paracoccus chinensis]|uniref:Tyr recombinase domain-containing protein n=1 Tax=Paracoccus chinensis TaxID=525640 RepID=A0A1G9JGF3_9RHOB|nr:hypothetical protein [Paracoccus chinensis]SDL36204.1 hypothetical protein SAMN04487971_109112 [Paracoccus chinensis]
MTRVNLQGIHKVRSRLADGSIREYHYVGRGKGAVRFWSSDSGIRIGSPDYIAAFSAASPRGTAAQGKFRAVILAFLDSSDFQGLAPRTQADLRTSIYHPTNGIDAKFGGAPVAAFDDPRIRKQALDWRDKIGGKVGDDRIRHLQRIVGYGLDRAMLRQHHLRQVKATYKSNRAEVFWLPGEIEAFEKGAPPHVSRILVAACETGLRPGDLVELGPAHLHPTPGGQRLVVWTRKRRRLASIPVTPRMARLIADTPAGQATFLVNKGGHAYQHENYLGDAVSSWRDTLKLRPELRLYDARGTAATRLLEAGAELKEIATHMGWSLKHAAEVIERYVALSPAMTDGLAKKLTRGQTHPKPG